MSAEDFEQICSLITYWKTRAMQAEKRVEELMQKKEPAKVENS